MLLITRSITIKALKDLKIAGNITDIRNKPECALVQFIFESWLLFASPASMQATFQADSYADS